MADRLIRVEDFNPAIMEKYDLLPRPKGNQHGRKVKYVDCLTAFDIETTTLPDIEQSIMYIWQFNINSEYTVIGRTWDQWLNLLKEMKQYLQGSLVIYVHNLSFEMQFLKGVYDFQPEEVFATESHKVLKATMMEETYEYRCSYFLSNMSLSAYLKKWKVSDLKLSGDEFDYSKVRFPWTELTDREMLYCINDVRGLVEALRANMTFDGDDLYTIPLTQTGYVRRDCKKAMKRYNHYQLMDMLPYYKVYEVLTEAFRGGNTHANRYYAGDVLDNVHSVDLSSAYPSVMVNCKYPMTAWFDEGHQDMARVRKLIKIRHKAVLMRAAMYDVDLRDELTGVPYLSRDKCRNIVNGVYDNGRILSADYLETTITDVDFLIIIRQYKFSSFDPYELYSARYRKLPSMLLDQVREYYRRKTALKNVEGQELYYAKAKEMLNALYGMTAQRPVRFSVELIDGLYYEKSGDPREMLMKANKKAFLSYTWGVWVTSHCRALLQRVIDQVGYDFVYCDTDSVKYVGDHDFTEFNESQKSLSIANNGYATDKHGVVHYLGTLEADDNGGYIHFATLGAKKYVYEDRDGLHITIAGVNKKKGARELGSIYNFKEGFIFREAGGTESVYNDNVHLTRWYDGHEVVITDNVVIKDSTYTLGITGEYKRILERAYDIKYSDHDILGYYTAAESTGAGVYRLID